MKLRLREIDATINRVNGRAIEHTYTPDDVQALAEYAETKLIRLGIPKKMREGAILMARSGDKLPSDYKYQRRVTYIELARDTQGWFLYIAKAQKAHQEAFAPRLVLTHRQHDKAAAHWRKEQNIVVV